jgi:hypothetical protein
MPKVEWHGDRLAAAAQQAAIEVARMTAEEVKGKAVDLAPLNMDTPAGTLRNSATVTDLKNGAEISFNTPYAVVMHESENYTPSHAGTGPNYLRQPLLDEEAAYHQAVADAMKAIFG